MSGFVVFLSIILGILVISAAVLIFLIVSLTRKISRTQKNVRTLKNRFNEISDFVALASSISALAGGLIGHLKVVKDKFSKKKGQNDRSQAKKTK